MVLVADSAVQIRHEDLKKWGVEICEYPMYVDGEPIEVSMEMSEEDKEEIRKILKDKNRNVSTSGLKEEDLLAIYRRHADEPILTVHMSTNASTASAQVITKIIQEHPELDITHYDTKHLVSAYSNIVRLAAMKLQAGATRDEMDTFFREIPGRTRHYGVLFDLFYLSRTGRIGKAKAAMGTAMKVIPILCATDPPGNLKSAGKVKKPAQAIRKFTDQIKQDWELWPDASLRALICCIGPHQEDAMKLKEAVEELKGDVEVVLYGTNHSNLPHAGPDYFDIGYSFV
jgi:DegV family protein with EDD domain